MSEKCVQIGKHFKTRNMAIHDNIAWIEGAGSPHEELLNLLTICEEAGVLL
jgi:hypothetical protein